MSVAELEIPGANLNLALQVTQAMSICNVPFNPARHKLVRVYCALRMLQDHGNPRDCAAIMEIILHDWLHSVGDVPTDRLQAKTSEIEFASAAYHAHQ